MATKRLIHPNAKLLINLTEIKNIFAIDFFEWASQKIHVMDLYQSFL